MEQLTGRFREVIAWQKSYDLTLAIYKATSTFPSDERFGLTQQMRRTAVSIPSNIAEGWGRNSTVDYLRFVSIARGSLYELCTQTLLATDLGYLPKNHPTLEQIAEFERIINQWIASFASRENQSNLK